jgi:hypothetical protein
MRLPRSVRNALISALVLLVLIVGAGVAYILLSGGTDTEAKPPPRQTAAKEPVVKAHKPAANAKESAAIEMLTSPVAAGSNASVNVRTLADSTCSIVVTYAGAKSTDSGLKPKTADDFGAVSWTWTVGNAVPAGNWPVTVTCVHNGRSAVVQSELQVTPAGSASSPAN